MANRILKNVKLSAVSASVPKSIYSIADYELMNPLEKKKFINKVGIAFKRHVNEDVTASDLCEYAANHLLDSLKIKRDDIDALVFVGQARDYIFPCTAVILQHKLGLSQNCMAFDIPLGCSGYVYGISILSALMESGTIKKGLLLCGETCSKTASYYDTTFFPLLGDAGTATLLEYDPLANPMYSILKNDGSGYSHLIMKGGGFREPWDLDIITEKPRQDGIIRKGYHVYINGAKIFEFSMREVAKSIRETLKYANVLENEIDFFVLHQANLMINESIRKTMKIESSKFINSMYNYGNTGVASVPLNLIANRELLKNRMRLLLCGFGVGLSWGSLYMQVENAQFLPILEM